MYLVTAKEMRDLDRHTIEDIGIPSVVLMENAGRAVIEELNSRWSEPKTAVVLAGKGNNGGDGWVIARYLLLAGWQVYAWMVGDESKMTKEARIFYQVYRRLATTFHYHSPQKEKLLLHLREADMIVDAMLGTGVQGELRPEVAEVVSLVNQQTSAFVVAVDLPTGVHSDTGTVSKLAVKADLTVTFQFPKWAQFLRPAADYCGEVRVVEVGILSYLERDREPKSVLNLPEYWRNHLAARDPWSHKGTHGHLLIIGGSKGMLGAVTMAGEAAYRSGAGLVTLTVPESQQVALSTKVTQELIWSWPGEESFTKESSFYFSERKSRFTTVAVGPGLGRFAGEDKWLDQLIQQIEVPLILDADALNICSDYPTLLQKRSPTTPVILTPHPGEMGRLLDSSVTEVEANRPQVAKELAMKWGVIVVLKGRYTIISFPDGRQMVNQTGGPALAKAGSGDMLTGIMGSLLAQRIPVDAAVPMAVYLHGKAGELAGTLPHSVTASDISAAIGPALQQLMSINVPL